MRDGEQPGDLLEIGDLERAVPRLPGPQQFAPAAQPQILFGQPEPVLRLAHQRQPVARGLGKRFAAQQPAARKAPVGDRRLGHRRRQRADLRALQPGRPQRADQAAGRGAGHQLGPDARLVQALDDADVGEATRGPAAQGQDQDQPDDCPQYQSRRKRCRRTLAGPAHSHTSGSVSLYP